ncbi:hypothetical protein DQM68_15280 [Leptospira mayottensis]|uniref:Uncharacterized protein n=2 Tax=Leptospira mayottensis TaxID=1137606 RepID=A0AA87SX72_9LEPT|nr:hypothetical protein DQM68_15280 [Leptospira mayottensis]AXR64867.1 hypothetical protein DQM28_12235 [Leptospira mayottensis]AZQ01713.1 hypothetical protein LEP1GSC190_06440 [Leptospira mayottensis 200901116]EKS00859.1 hypothetical protein LEP1GSC125_2227 [Leptospira mayottensis 200901122]TGM89639.1 hypothetical protein EHR03_19020 [Leptospira mayottensis]
MSRLPQKTVFKTDSKFVSKDRIPLQKKPTIPGSAQFCETSISLQKSFSHWLYRTHVFLIHRLSNFISTLYEINRKKLFPKDRLRVAYSKQVDTLSEYFVRFFKREKMVSIKRRD